MEHTKQLLSIPLSKLVPSAFNVRRHTAGQVEELAALIESQGLLHPLIVTEQMIGRGRARQVGFAVAAGERRRRALLLLQQRGRLPKEHEVACELAPPERALEISLAENSGREPMHPADEFEAFQALIDQGKGVEDIAARFGVSPLTVRRRLKLAALSPRLLTLYRETAGPDAINLDQLMALALSDDHATQERVWADARPWERTPEALRRSITANEVEAAGNALVRFVGLETYEASGGGVRRDLFDDDQSRYIGDPELLRRLAADKLEALAIQIRAEGWAWVEPRVELDSHGLRQCTPCTYALRELDAAEQAEVAELEARSAELARQTQAMEELDEWPAAEAECIDLEERDIAARRRAIELDRRTWTPEMMAHAGVIVTVNREGDAEVIRGLVREADRKAVERMTAPPTGEQTRDSQSNTPGREAQCDAAVRASTREDPVRAGHSDSLLRRLAAHRAAALQAVLIGNTPVALAALAHALAIRLFDDHTYRPGNPLHLAPQSADSGLLTAADDLPDSKAWQAVQTARAAWRARLPERASDWLAWLIGQPQSDVLDLVALCAASTLTPTQNPGTSGERVLAGAAGLDLGDWWQPTAASYLGFIPKTKIIEVLKEAGAVDENGGLVELKKDALVATAEKRLLGKRWLPEPLRPDGA